MIRIAMWSGPRNISTAMMRSWENRADTQVVDEPLYGPYLHQTGKQHPGHAAIKSDQGTDWRPIVQGLATGDLSDAGIYYQKHMTHHITPDIDLSFIDHLRNAFLIRHPNEVLASYLRKHPEATPEDLGYPQQVRIFEHIKNRTGQIPPVIESKSILINPEDTLTALCQTLDVPFDPAMLAWPKGYRDSDGIWAEHWYNRVIESTGFAQYQAKTNRLTTAEQQIADQCLPYYEALSAHKLRPVNTK